MTESGIVSLDSKPEPIELDLAKTAVVCVDMQNAFLRKGGLFDLLGWLPANADEIIAQDRKIIEAARSAGVKVVFVKMSYNRGLTNAGGPASPNWYKEMGLVLPRKDASTRDKTFIEGTWGEQIVEEVTPLPEEAVVKKQRYSGFAGTNLDLVLRTLGVRYCAFIGGATNVCVAATLMDAFSLDYWPILVTDAVYTQCPPVTTESTCWTVENVFGWVTTTAALLTAIANG